MHIHIHTGDQTHTHIHGCVDNSPEKLEAVEQMQTAANDSRQPMHVHFPLQKVRNNNNKQCLRHL